MATSTIRNQKELTYFQPRENQLYSREGLDRKNIRYELSNTTPLDLTTQWLEEEDQLYIDQETVDLSDGPTGIGEGGGAGVNFFVQNGDRKPTTRYARGFTLNSEDVRAGNDSVGEQRDALMELIDFEHDKYFLFGHWRGDGQWVPGVFQWIDNNLPSERIFDCSQYTSGGSETDYATDGVQENLIKFDAFRAISNRLMSSSNPQWGAMVGTQDALSHFNKVSDGSGGEGRASYWDRLNSNDAAGVGVRNQLYMPDSITFSRAASGQNPVSFDLTAGNNQGWDGLGNDEVYLFPEMSMVRDNLWELYEQPSPTTFGPIEQEVGRSRIDYVERYAQDFDPTGNYSDATDIVKLTNVSALFS